MRRTTRWIAAVSLLAAACGEGTVPTQSDTSATPAPSFAAASAEGYLTHVHVMPTKAQNWDALAKTGAAPGGGTGIFWHGGPVMHTVNVVAIYWGTTLPMYTNGPSAGGTGGSSGDNSLIGKYLKGVGGSSYWKINTDYTDGSGPVPLAVNYAGYWAHNVDPGTKPSDAAIQAEIVSGFTSGNLTYNANTIYSVFTGPDVNLGGGFKTQYCAYHGHFTWNNNQVIYSIQPYNDGVSVCQEQGTGPNSPATGDATVNTLAHEIEEAATDPQLNAWWDRRGYENADKCAWTFGTTSTASNGALYNETIGSTKFLIQRNWLNRGSGGCSTGI